MIRWMKDSAVIVWRYPDAEEEPDLINLEIIATNGDFAVRTAQFYCGRESVEQFGAALSRFPVNAADRPEFSRAAENVDDHSPFLRIVAYLEGARTALKFRFVERGYFKVSDGVAEFSIPAETAAINRLGVLMQEFSKLNHSELHWTPRSGELFTEPQPVVERPSS